MHDGINKRSIKTVNFFVDLLALDMDTASAVAVSGYGWRSMDRVQPASLRCKILQADKSLLKSDGARL